ncbi:Multimodular transpeptidase-transglycosylase [Methylophaga frappieri]|uniref:Penicillin-binding protein 1B n=1 Tax=Methylophaga frappieri (strain ATCC BAA-2434 / DSM 25690 / JAM7) TaxID=754477 RepID=I1YK41_METFJ|nr:penicillin-binding protein 1B [Methylophaga frappieri]AFJ03284.1 Multimodular transpeptidase-transglycosylase [Methylophaga frappieri]
MKSKRTAKSTSSHHPLRRLLFNKVTFLILILIFTAGIIGLWQMDRHIRAEFEGKRWALPAKVYARPLELYAGASLSIADLKIELQALGYRLTGQVEKPGQANITANRAVIASRGFGLPDGREPAHRMVLRFQGQRLTSLQDFDGQELTLVRLEPALIGGIYPLNNEDRDLIQLQDAPPALTDALIEIEDQSFYQHHGISLKGIGRALIANLKAGAFVQGGSTLTQQLIKNFYLTADRTLLRKLMEIPMAILLERRYSKDEILEAYLNEVYLGQDGSRAIHGFGLGAAYYFARPLNELPLEQLALLAALVKGPSYYDPRRHPERAKQRRDLVLKALLDANKISAADYLLAANSPLGVVTKGSLMKEAYPAYLDLVKRQLRQQYNDADLGSEGLQVFTSLDPIAQRKAETAMTTTIQALQGQHGTAMTGLQGSMVVTDPQTGEVLALIGDRQTRNKGFNRALDAKRQIGSLLKPAVYLTALENNYTLASVLNDQPYELDMPNGDTWAPQNYDRKSHQDVLLIDSLSHSYNIATARLGMTLGLDNVISTIRRLGVDKPLQAFPSLLLGAQSFSTLEVASLYQTIAAGGFRIPPRAIRAVTDADGTPLSRYPLKLDQTIDPANNYLLQTALVDVMENGTGRYARQQLPTNMTVAGKTGTSDQQRDSWFAGYSANRLAVVWLGQDNNSALPFTGASGALPVWRRYMESEPLLSLDMLPPPDIETAWVNQFTGKLSAPSCENARELPFVSGTTPTTLATCHAQSDQNLQNPVEQSIDWIRGLFD